MLKKLMLSTADLLHTTPVVRLLLFVVLTVGCLTTAENALAQNVGDYRSNATNGTWNTLANWQIWSGTAWGTPTVAQGYPGQNGVSGAVHLLSGQTMSLNISPANGIASLTVDGTLTFGNNATARTLTVTGDILVNTGGSVGVFNSTTTHQLNIGGNLTVNGTFELVLDANSLCNATFNGAGTQTISGTGAIVDFNTLTNTAGTLALARNITIVGNLTVSAGTFDLGTFTANRTAAGGTLTVGAGASMRVAGTNSLPTNFNTYTLNASSTVEYYGSAQTVTNATYGNLTLSGSGTKTLQTGTTSVAGNLTLSGTVSTTTVVGLTISGNLVIGDGTTFTSNATYALTVTGTTTVGGGTSGTLAIATAATNTQTFNGVVTINNGAGFTESVAATLSFRSDVTVGGTLTEFGAATVGIAGNLTDNGTYAASTGTHTFSGATKTIGGTSAISIANVAVTGTYTNNGTLSSTATLSGAGGLTNGTGATLNIGGTSTITTLTATATGNSVNYNGGAQTIKVVTYYNLTLSGSGAKTFAVTTVSNNLTLSGTASASIGANLTVGGNLNVGDGTSLTVGAFNFAVTGTTTVGGGTSGTLSITSTTGTKTFTGAVTVNFGASFSENVAEALTFGSDVTINGTLTENGTATVGIGGSLTNNGTYTASTGVHTFSGTGSSFSGTNPISIASVTVTGSYTNNATLTVGTALAGTGSLTQGAGATLNLGGTSGITSLTASTSGNTVNYTGAAQTVFATNYFHLTLSGSGTKTLQAGTTSTGGNFTLSGTASTTCVTGLTIGGNVVIGNGTSLSAGNFTHSVAGNWSNNGGTFTAGTSTFTFNGGSLQTIDGTSSSAFSSLTINNSGGVSLGVQVTVGGTLTLTSGVVTTSSTYLLTVTSNSVSAISGASASSYINGPLALTFPANVSTDGTTYTFPVGENGNYRPIDLVNIRTGATGPVVRVTLSGTGASTGDGTTITSIAPRNWYVQSTSGNFTSATIRITESGLIPTNVIGQSTAQSGNYVSIGGINIGTSVTSVQTVSSFPAYFAIGISAIKPLYSYQSGNWDSTTTWTTDPSGTLSQNPRVPGTMDKVIVLNGRTISITANTKRVVTLTINAGGILDIQSTTGHNFGTVSGQGKLMLSSNNFPGGTFTSFVASGGGTIEYYNLNGVSLSTSQLNYDNLIISNYSTSTNTVYLNNGSNPTIYTINGSFSLKNYSSGSNTFYFGNPTPSDNLINMTVYGDFNVDAGCNVRVNNFATSHAIPNPSDEGATPYPVHTLSLYGNLTNNGSIRFTGLPSPVNPAYYTLTTTATGGVNYGDVQVFFYGGTNNTVTCNGTTDFFRFVVAKGADNTYTLEVISSSTNNFALYAPNYQGNSNFSGGTINGYGYGVYYKALFIHYGTLKLDANINIPSLTEGGQDFNLVPTAGLWINGATVSTTDSGLNGTGYQAATLYGYLRISAGKFSTGDAAGIVLGTLGTPTIRIEGTGTLDVSQAWASVGTNLMSYVQTGGTANFRLQGENHAGPMLGLSSPNASFVMSGGTMNFSYNTFIDASTDYQVMDIESQVGYYQVTGGTVNLNLPSSATTYTANSTAPFYNLNITNKTGTGTTSIQWNTPGSNLTVLNNLSIGAGAVLNLGTSQINLAVGGNFTILSGATFTPAAADTTTFNGSGYQAFVNAGTITTAMNNLTITNYSTTTIVSNNLTVNGLLTIGQNATLNDSGKYVYVNSNIVNSGTHNGLATGGGIRLTGTTAQTITGGGKFFNLIVDKTNATGVSALSNLTVTGALRLVTNPNLNIGAYNLMLDSAANVYTDLATTQAYDSLHMIVTTGLASDNGVTKRFSSSSTTFLYPIGTGTKYRPAKIQFTASPTQYGSITVRPVASADPMVQAAGKAITFYWKVTSSNFSGIQANSINQTYYYYPADAPTPSDEVNYIPATYITPVWVPINNTGAVLETLTPRQILFNSVNYIDGEYTCGTSAAFGAIPTYYSNSNSASVISPAGADWNTAGTWCTGSNTGTPAAALPDNMSNAIFIIGDGSSTIHTITIGASHHIQAGNVFIQSDAVLDLGSSNGHNFGSIQKTQVSGNGKLRIASSAYFPTGDWGTFLGSAGGTVEYYETAASGALQMPSTYSLPAGGTANIAGYYNLTVLPYASSTITFPNASQTIYHTLTISYSSGGGTTGCVTQLNNGATTTTVEVKGTFNINQYGVLQYMNVAAQNVIADSDLTIAAGGTLQVRNAGTANLANTFTAYGNIINNGTLDLDPSYPTNDNYHCMLAFTGSYSKALKNVTQPTRTRLYGITVNKGSTIDSLVNISIDTTGFVMGNGGLTLQNGTFRLTSPVSMALSSGGFTIPVTGGLSANGGTFNIVTGAASADLILKGRLEIISGAVNVGPAINSAATMASSISYSAAGSPTITISGGSLNVYTQVRRDTVNNSGSLNYTQTGGTVTIGGMRASTSRAAFEVVNDGSRFVMSNGSLIIANGGINAISPYDVDIEPDFSNVTGGTVQLGLSGVTSNQTVFTIQTSVPLWNVTLESTSNSCAIQETYNSTFLGNLSIGGTSGYYNANGLNLEIGGNLTNNNANAANGITVGGFQAQSLTQTTSFLGTGNQTITGTASNRTNFANLEIATAASHTTFLSSGTCTIVVNGDLTLTSGTFNDGANSVYLLGDVDNNSAHVSPNSTAGGMIFAGSATQGMTGSGIGVFGNIEINNSGNGVDMTDNSTINGRLKFTNGYLYIDDYALTLGANATIAGSPNASNLILLNGVLSDKGVTKIFPSGAYSFTFPIGANGKYTPATYNFSSNSNSGASVRVIPVDGLHPSINTDSVSNYLDYYWYVSSSGFSSSYNVTHTYTYSIGDVVGSPAHIERYDNSNSTWSTVSGTITPPTFAFTSASLLDGSYTIGDVFSSLPLLYSIASGNWFNTSLWSTDTTTKVPYGKIPRGNPVYIRTQDSVALASNSANASSVAIYGVLDAENTTFHNIGQVSGSGKIRISSTSNGFFAFPGGTYDAFFANPLSTVEFYGTTSGRLPLDPGNTTKPYQNVIISGNSTKYISSVDTKVNGNLTIQSGSKLDNTQYNKNIYILGNWIDNNTTPGFTPGSGIVYFSDSAGTQQILMGADTSTETFYSLAIVNPGGVTISKGKVTVSNRLILTSGNINTTSSHSLTITTTDTNAVIGSGVNSFVNGPLKKQIASGSNFQFPVGDAVSSSRNRVGYVSVRNTSTTGSQIWTAQFFDKNPTTDGYDITKLTSPLQSVVYNEYWTVTGPSGASSNVALTWDQNTGMSSSPSSRALSLVAEWGTPVSGSWNSISSFVSDFGQDSGIVVTSIAPAISGTQVFTIGASTAAVAALITSIQTGMWNNPNTWNAGRVPGPNDSVVISSPYDVVLNSSSSVTKFIINNGGTYNDSTNVLTVTGNVILNGTWIGSGKMSLTTSGDTLFGTGGVTGQSVLEIAGGTKTIASTANLTFKTVSILSGDTLSNSGSLTLDSLSGASSSAVFNNLSGSTLTIDGSLLTAGTLNASYANNTVVYDGNVAQAIKPASYYNVLLTGAGSKSITSGTITIGGGTMELRPGPVFTIGSGATVTTTGAGKILIDTTASYVNLSSSTPVVQIQTRIKGHDGWRMLSAPNIVNVSSMFGGKFVTQGFTGSTYPSLQPNLLWWDETSQGTSLQAWRQPSAMTDTVKLGRGYMYYVFNGTQITGQSAYYGDTLPMTMSALGKEQALTTAFNFGVTATLRTGGGTVDTTYLETNAADYGWNLVGNPTPSTINWNSSSGWTKTNVDGSIYVWDPADSTGGYKTWNGTTGSLGSGLISPFQAFWVKANNTSPLLTCDNGVKTTGGAFLGKIAFGSPDDSSKADHYESKSGVGNIESPTADSASSPPVISLVLSEGSLRAQAYIMFSDQGRFNYDPYDAFSLVPLTNDYLIFYTISGQGQQPMQIQDLPDTGLSDLVTIPLYVGGTTGGQPIDGSFSLSWKFSGKLPTNWSIELMDDEENKAYSMTEDGGLAFLYDTPASLVPSSTSLLEKDSGTSSSRRSITSLPRPVVLSVPTSNLSRTAAVTSRFRVVVSPKGDLSGFLPSTPELPQNYPNPFNPTTNIRFSIPAKSRVTIDVFNVLGQRVATLADQDYSAGSHVVTWTARETASGVYFCRMIAGNQMKTIKMVLLK